MEKTLWKKCYMHIDMDAFFASVEQHDHPEWKGKPVIVGGLPGERRSVVSTASYEARKYGVHSAMPTSKAYELCPKGIFIHPNMKRYNEISLSIMNILENFSPDVNQLSIDEACVDLTGTERLFGKPEEIVEKIRNEIFTKTGLTVSIGLASTRYLSKIASEINKPNGFFKVEPGKEIDFMQNLKLEKLWGIGEKTLKKINSFGFFTTKQLYCQNLQTLESIFGKATAQFLYNCLRGIETIGTKKTEHSISAETTFCFDLTNIYNAQTALMELSESVMFRLNKENAFSRTCALKIRYEDFTTFTVQQTQNEYITSSNDLYERISALLQKKYEQGRGIRLLGVCVSNIETKENGRQENLIDFGEKKKQAVEDSIMNLHQKFPEIKITKARILQKIIDSEKNIIIAISFIMSLFLGGKVYSETTKKDNIFAGSISNQKSGDLIELPKTDEKTIFSFQKNSNQFDFTACGWWQANLQTPFSFSFNSPSSSEKNFSSSVPVFTQKVDLSMNFWLNKKFFFETSFADEFSKNTIATGYIGSQTEYLKSLRISNRSIIFPSLYSIDDFNLGIGGGENQAPGISASISDINYILDEKPKWQLDAALRYDFTKQHNITFYGKNSVQLQKNELKSFLKGQIFFLPDKELCKKLSGIYVEDEKGDYKDTSNRKYSKIANSDYMVNLQTQIVYISKSAKTYSSSEKIKNIIFEFRETGSTTELKKIIGNYQDKSSYLGQVQEFFGSQIEQKKKINLSKYSFEYCTQINSSPALIVQSPQGFSPFIASFRYDLGNVIVHEVSVSSEDLINISNFYSCQIADMMLSLSQKDFFNEKHTYADVFSSNSDDSTDEKNNGIPQPKDLFPFADRFPEVYLNLEEKTNLKIIAKNLTPVSRYDIGTDASQGSVRLYKNGIPDIGAKYEKESGQVIPSNPAGDFDKIYITWEEDSNDAQDGNISSAIGFSYAWTKNIIQDICAATKWNVNPEKKYATSESSSQGYAALCTGINIQTEKFFLKNSSAISIQNPNTTNLYRILSMDQNESKTHYLNKDDGHFLKDNITPILTSTLEENFPFLEKENERTLKEKTEDGQKIKGISGYAIPLSWEFEPYSEIEDISGTKKQWASINIQLSSSNILKNAKTFCLALKAKDYLNAKNYDLYLQLGIDAKNEKEINDYMSIPTWKITDKDNPLVKQYFSTEGKNINEDGWQTIEIFINDEQQSKLSNLNDLRIICVQKENNRQTQLEENELFIGPYELKKSGMTIETCENIFASSIQIKDNSIPQKSTFNENDNFCQEISWEFLKEPEEKDTVLKAQYFFNETDSSFYEKIVFFFKSNTDFSATCNVNSKDIDEDDDGFCLILDSNSNSIHDEGKIFVKASIKKKDMFKFFSNETSIWHEFEINLNDKKIKIDGKEIEAKKLYINKNNSFNRFFIKFSPIFKENEEYKVFQIASFSIDEFHMKDISPYYLLQNKTHLLAKNEDFYIGTKKNPLIKNPSINAKLLASNTFSEENSKINSHDILSQLEGSIQIATIDFSFQSDFSSYEKNGITLIGQKISTSKPLFSIFLLDDSFIFSHSDYSNQKETKMSIDLSPLFIPIDISAKLFYDSSITGKTQKQCAEFSFFENFFTKKSNTIQQNFQKYFPTLKFLIETSQKQRTPSSYKNDFENSTYFESLKESTTSSFSKGNKNAYNRNESQILKYEQKLPFMEAKLISQWKISNIYSTIKNITNEVSQNFEVSIPLKISNHFFSIKYSKSQTINDCANIGKNYIDDFSTMYSNIKKNNWFWQTFIFEDFFSSSISNKVLRYSKENEDKNNFLSYSTNYFFGWKRNLFASLLDFFVPLQFDLEGQRDIRTNFDSKENYQFRARTSFASINLFGKYGTSSLLNFFETDEYNCSFTATARIPDKDFSSCLAIICAYVQGTFFIKNNDFFKSASQIKYSTDDEYNFSQIIALSKKTSFNPFLEFLKLFASKKFLSKIQNTQSNFTTSLNFSFTKTTDDFLQNYALNSKIEGNIGKNLSVNCGFDIDLNCSQKKADILSANINIGAKIQF